MDTNTLYYVYKDILNNLKQHQFVAMNASIAFFSLFAIIPIILLIIFVLGTWLNESTLAFERLQEITQLLLPELSQLIMGEVRNIASQHVGWEIFWILLLFVGSTPLTSTLRSCITKIFGEMKRRFFLINKLFDLLSVITILILFTFYSFINVYLDDMSAVLAEFIPLVKKEALTSFVSFILLVLIMIFFFKSLIPVKMKAKYLLAGSLVTCICWFFLSIVFEFFTSLSAGYGLFFGGMRNIFISIIWLYLNTGALLLGLEVIAASKNQDLILIKQLFKNDNMHRHPILPKLMKLFGQKVKKNHILFNEGDHDQRLFYVVEGEVGIVKSGKRVDIVKAGEYLGELSLLNKVPRVASAYIASDWARVIIVDEKRMRRLIKENHDIAMQFLNHMARKLQAT